MLRALAKQLARHGRRIFEGTFQKQGAKANPRNKDVARFGDQQNPEAVRSRYFLRLDGSARTNHPTWVQRLTGSGRSVVQNLRQNAGDVSRLQERSHELVTGRKLISLYALVGLTMKAGSRKIEFEDEQFDNICEEIKNLMQPNFKISEEDLPSEEIQLCNLQLGPLIAKGSNSAVYSARLCSEENDSEETDSFEIIDEEAYHDVAVVTEEDLADIDLEWRTRSDITIWDNYWDSLENTGKPGQSLEDSKTMDLAIKMMFNYDTESDSDTILRAMQNETVPAQLFCRKEHRCDKGSSAKKQLDPHPNVVDIQGVFVDEVPDLKDALSLYPDALPPRLNPDGSGHNKTMFLVMKRYDTTLRGYLEQHTPSMKESLFLFAQLLEAVLHLNEHEIAHRDLKSDNILLDGTNLDLVVSDFGCCLADNENGLKIPYTNRYVDKGGNAALMAPEIACAECGKNSYLDYSASDLWTVGTLAYEVFGCGNPFYRNSCGTRLDSKKYSVEDLPPLPDNIPAAIRHLVKSLLHRDPKKRPSARAAANLIHLYLWAPENWLSSETAPTKLDVTRWLLLEAAGVMCHRYWSIRTNPLLSLKQCFLSRSSMDGVLQGFNAILCID